MNRFNVTLEKISSKNLGPFPLRTDIVVGYTKALPEVGLEFAVIAEAFVPDAIARLVMTSMVTKVWKETTGTRFETETGSVYEVRFKDLQ